MRQNSRTYFNLFDKSGNIMTCRQCGFTGTKRIGREVARQVRFYNGAFRSIWEGKHIRMIVETYLA